MKTTINQTEGADRRAVVKHALARYPYLDDDELADLLHWFRKEARAGEITVLTADPGVARAYQRLKAEHLDRLRGARLFWGAALAITAAAGSAIVISGT